MTQSINVYVSEKFIFMFYCLLMMDILRCIWLPLMSCI